MISLNNRLRKGKVVVVDIETTGLSCGEEGKESSRIIEIAAVKYEKRHPVEQFHTYVACPLPIPAEISALTGIADETLAGAPPAPQALKELAAFAEGCILAGYNLAFACKFLDHYGAECGAKFTQDRVDILPMAKRLLHKRVENYKLKTVAEYCYYREPVETLPQCAEAAADILFSLARRQERSHNYVHPYRITVPRRKIRYEITGAEFTIAENLMRCALFGKEHPLFPLWVYKCAEKLEYVSRFVDKKDEKLPQREYEMIFTGYNEAVWETRERLEGGRFRNDGDYEVTDALCEKVFAIYDAVRVSCMPYLMSRTETYHPDEYASIIVQAVETEGKDRQIKIDYDNLYTKYAIYGK